MLSTFKRRTGKLESLRKKAGPKSLDDWLTELQDYSRRTGISLDEASAKFVPELRSDDLERFIAELVSVPEGNPKRS
jgi:hypothetical protein